ncbi:UDP-N-acetylglucosamine-N-acetylmuramyl-(pentapeptide) pyrophosphoryl-undecaprenol N-acetylglucosamine transferase [Deinococcus aerius]|uniref:UDP-N-acetylglucosamine-N-acetylmuramyl-(Pentapeptide) pyrophosphoryl-undecaprenol N-acetylglucosamine transferase n=1 Tax=Deinococcus aerius TaxID=200253 RepID=A0A2I9CU75_9DEIO|nr:hypothetical protein [Deinococcus aerius]GBF05374.1 UDP-N-acetylglucosamine-N-acetylmuramyl-(pentapeptide) pyrophosphoryl-undecaprenol N-acetylglucosamine transferase [Deinococcus aerius]
MVEQSALAGRLGEAVLECAAAGTRASMREAALGRSPVGAAGRFADLVERHLREARAPNPSHHD